MPPHTRSQRRRQPNRQQARPATSAESQRRAPSVGPTIPLESPQIESSLEAPRIEPPLNAPSRPTGAQARAARTPSRRVLSRPAPEPVDYTADYRAAGRDLRWIAIWTVLLFAAMIALKFSGLV